MNYNHVFITGGAGFIGCNFAAVLLAEGHTVTIFDNLSRPGTPLNLAWLQQPHPRFVRGDICDYSALQKAMTGTDVVYHLAAQAVNAISIWAEFGEMLNEVVGRKIQPSHFEQWRPGDQPVFICDTSKAKQDFNWEPEISVRSGVADLAEWVQRYKNEIAATLSGC